MASMLDKSMKKHKKGLWSPDEDQKLRNYVLKHGHGCWSSVAINAGERAASSTRNDHSCILRLKRRAGKTAETEAQTTKNDYKYEEIRELESLTSFPHIERSARKCSFPKVLFAEWLSYDHFKNDHNLDNHSSSLEDNLVDGLLVDEGTFCSESDRKRDEVSVDDSPFKLEDEILESCLFDYFPGEFCMSYDMYA
ncbi:Transcription factor LAF1 [Sesamum angolense]|uniref:Transcription factor LAF1 n=1 Tax=Sesamum angolense TaxID=2727404 RepID=A0AAE1X279_9LAMI|nr:Transcription factor LAF1 [Sesamum angolense]